RYRQKKSKAQSFSHFKNQLHKKDTGGLLYNVYKFGAEFDQEQSIIEIVQNILAEKLHETNKFIVHLSKLKGVVYLFDLRNHFRQLIRFLFKNLDDAHSSVNNSAVSTIVNYLLIKNLYEKGIYRTTY